MIMREFWENTIPFREIMKKFRAIKTVLREIMNNDWEITPAGGTNTFNMSASALRERVNLLEMSVITPSVEAK